MSKTYSNVPKSKRGGYDLWGRRPMSGCHACSWSKKKCRQIERRRKKFFILQNIADHGELDE